MVGNAVTVRIEGATASVHRNPFWGVEAVVAPIPHPIEVGIGTDGQVLGRNAGVLEQRGSRSPSDAEGKGGQCVVYRSRNRRNAEVDATGGLHGPCVAQLPIEAELDGDAPSAALRKLRVVFVIRELGLGQQPRIRRIFRHVVQLAIGPHVIRLPQRVQRIRPRYLSKPAQGQFEVGVDAVACGPIGVNLNAQRTALNPLNRTIKRNGGEAETALTQTARRPQVRPKVAPGGERRKECPLGARSFVGPHIARRSSVQSELPRGHGLAPAHPGDAHEHDAEKESHAWTYGKAPLKVTHCSASP